MKLSVLRFLRRDGQPAPADATIPGDVVELIRGAEISFRDLGEDGLMPCVHLDAGGIRGSWFHDATETPIRLKRRFPFLTEPQVKRCTDLVEALVMQAVRSRQMALYQARRAKRKNWVTDY